MDTSRRGRCLLQDLLNRIDMTQADLARKTKIHPRMISHYASDTKRMHVDAMRAISKAIGCHMEDLYEWIDED